MEQYVINFVIISMFVIAGLYAMSSFGLYKLAKNNNYDDIAFMAWVPVLRRFLFGYMGGDANIFNRFKIEAKYFALILALLSFSFTVPYFGYASTFIGLIFLIYAYYNMYSKIDCQRAKLFTFLSLVVPVFSPVYIFLNRDKKFDFALN